MLKYLQALLRYNSEIQVHLLNSEIRQVVNCNHRAMCGKLYVGRGQNY